MFHLFVFFANRVYITAILYICFYILLFVFLFLFYKVPPTIKGENITTEVSALLHSILKLECEVRGIPAPTITWYKDGSPIISGPQALYREHGQFLQISHAQVSDSAQYKCQATNEAGMAEKIFQVDVYGRK